MVCPSSPLPPTFTGATGNYPTQIVMPTYAGVAGCVALAVAPTDGGADNGTITVNNVLGAYVLGSDPTRQPPRPRPTPASSCAPTAIAANGALVPNRANNLAALADGTSNTMLVGEQSGWQYVGGTATPGTTLPGKQVDLRSSSLFGAYAGANISGTPAGVGQPAFAGGLALNLTTVRYPINAFSTRLASGANSTSGSYPYVPLLTNNGNDGGPLTGGSNGQPQYGVCPTSGGPSSGGSTPPDNAVPPTYYTGANNPIQSQHPAGALVLMGDGSARMLKNETDEITLKRYACRDDRLVISDTVN